MLPNEKEIAQLISDNVEATIPGSFAFPPNTIAVVWGVDKAAHAIAEKLAEGVVWDGSCEVETDSWGLRFLRPLEGVGTLEDGQLVTVTVKTREESDGQGVG